MINHLFAMVLVCVFWVSNVNAGEGDDAVRNLAPQIKANTGSAEALKQNYTGPLYSDQQMTGLGGSSFEDGQIGCQTSANFLQVSLTAGPTGDISNLNVAQDINLDGTQEYAYRPPFQVSGVCANGVISCTPGTWNNCRHYRWNTDQQARVTLELTNIQNVGGCYCVNNSCATNYVANNLQKVLDDTGGAIAGALVRVNPMYTVSEVRRLGSFIQYSALRTVSCAEGRSDLTRYQNNPGNMIGDALIDPQANQMLQLITNNPNNASMPQEQTCVVSRAIRLDSETSNIVVNTASQGDDYYTVSINLIGRNWSSVAPSNGLNFHTEFENPPISNISCNDGGVSFSYSGAQHWPDATALWPGTRFDNTVSHTMIQQPSCDNNSTAIFQIRDNTQQGGADYSWILGATLNFNVSYCGAERDTITNGCATLENNLDCTLTTEVVDGTVTVNNGVNTRAALPPQLMTAYGDYCSRSVTRDWNRRQRTYRCNTSTPMNFDQALDRAAHIQNTLTDTSFEDRGVDANGNPVTTRYAWQTPEDVMPVDTCVHVCKTRREVVATDVGTADPVTSLRVNPTSYETDYKECSNNVCPLEPGDEVVTPCGCVNDFPDAAIALQAIRYASKDMICSQ